MASPLSFTFSLVSSLFRNCFGFCGSYWRDEKAFFPFFYPALLLPYNLVKRFLVCIECLLLEYPLQFVMITPWTERASNVLYSSFQIPSLIHVSKILLHTFERKKRTSEQRNAESNRQRILGNSLNHKRSVLHNLWRKHKIFSSCTLFPLKSCRRIMSTGQTDSFKMMMMFLACLYEEWLTKWENRLKKLSLPWICSVMKDVIVKERLLIHSVP